MTTGQQVRVHFNLHSHDWSIVAMEGDEKGRVIGHAPELSLIDCAFKVSEASRQRVILKRCRSVHAWITGKLTTKASMPVEARGFTYNPYRAGTFTYRDTHEPVTRAARVWFDRNGKALATQTT
jgi:hypothetical protein